MLGKLLNKARALVTRKKTVYQPFFDMEAVLNNKGLSEAEVYRDIYGRIVPDAESQFYPPKLVGVSVFSVDAILHRYRAEIDKIWQHAQIGNHRKTPAGHSLFTDRYINVVRRFIEYVHMVPASEYHHHSHPGGLLRHSLEVALIAMREAKESRPPTTNMTDTDEKRRVRYIYASWLVGLLHDTGKLFSDMHIVAVTVLDPKTKQSVSAATYGMNIPTWKPQAMSLIEWAEAYNVERYTVIYRKRQHKAHDQLSSILLGRVLKGEGLDFIIDAPGDLYGEMNSVLSGYMTDRESFLAQRIRSGDAKSTIADINHIEEKTFGRRKKSIKKQILDAMRSARSGWVFNTKNGHAWVLGDKVFLRWSKAYDSIAKKLREEGVEGLPFESKTLRTIMEEHNIITAQRSGSMCVLFSVGAFTDEEIHQIKNLELTPTTEEIDEVVFPAYVFDADPLLPSAEGVMVDPISNEYSRVTRVGDVLLVIAGDDAEPSDVSEKDVTDKVNTSTGNAESKAEKAIPAPKPEGEPTPKAKPQKKKSPKAKKAESEVDGKAAKNESKPERKPYQKPKSDGQKSASKIRFDNTPSAAVKSEADTEDESQEQVMSTEVEPQASVPDGEVESAKPKGDTPASSEPEAKDSSGSLNDVPHALKPFVGVPYVIEGTKMYADIDAASKNAGIEAKELHKQLTDAGYIRIQVGAGNQLFTKHEINGVTVRVVTLNVRAIKVFTDTAKDNQSSPDAGQVKSKRDNKPNTVKKGASKNKQSSEEKPQEQKLQAKKAAPKTKTQPKREVNSSHEAPKPKRKTAPKKSDSDDVTSRLSLVFHRAKAGSLGQLLKAIYEQDEDSDVVTMIKPDRVSISITAASSFLKQQKLEGFSATRPSDIRACIERDAKEDIKVNAVSIKKLLVEMQTGDINNIRLNKV